MLNIKPFYFRSFSFCIADVFWSTCIREVTIKKIVKAVKIEEKKKGKMLDMSVEGSLWLLAMCRAMIWQNSWVLRSTSRATLRPI